MTKVLIATEKPFAPVAVNGIREICQKEGFELVLLEKYTQKSELLAAVADVDAMIVRSDKIDNEVFDAAKNLKIVVRAGAGTDAIDLKSASAHNVVVMNTPGQNANAVAEMVMSLFVYAVRNFFNGKPGTELMGKRLGLMAYGNTAKNVARIAKGFGMEVCAYDSYCPDEVMLQDGVQPIKTPQELFKTCSFVALHLPATPETIKSINYELVNNMPKGGVLLNAARQEIIDEAGLLKLLQERTDLKYLTDCKPEPEIQAEMEKLEGRFFASPKKLGAQTAEANINAGLAAARQIASFIKEGVTKFQVNK